MTPAPWGPDAEEGRRLLRDELARPEYADTWWERLLRWFEGLFAAPGVGTSTLTPWLAVGAALLVAAIAALAWRALTRRAAPVDERDDALVDTRRTARDYRELVAAHLAAGDPEAAYLDAFRAVVAAAAESGHSGDAPHRTARRVAGRLADLAPELSADLFAAAGGFDAVRYGQAHVEPADIEAVTRLDRELTARLVSGHRDGAPAGDPSDGRLVAALGATSAGRPTASSGDDAARSGGNGSTR